jgi:hypothetical protein
LSGEPATAFQTPTSEPERIDRLTRFAPGAGMMEPEANQTPLKILTDLDVPEINNVIVTRSRQVWVNEVDDE